MGKTKIEWSEYSWGPIMGCTHAGSPGCDNCYARSMIKRFAGRKGWPVDAHTVTLFPKRLELPLHWKKPRRIFVCSMSDLFHKDVPPWFVCKVWQTMRKCPRHTFQILTKRPRRMLRLMKTYIADHEIGIEPLSNVWLGVSICTPDELWKLDALRACPAAVRFVSFEPLLADMGTVDLTGIGQVIVGGESGPNARPMHPDWARSLRDRCRAAGVPFFYKQNGAWLPYGQDAVEPEWETETFARFQKLIESGVRCHSFYDGEVSYRVGKKRVGRLLDGREHNEMPEVGT